MALEDFTDGYITALLWSSITDDGEPMDDIDAELSAEAVATMRRQCSAFYGDHAATWAEGNRWSDERAGHDFALTRNFHGTGFWDRFSARDDFEGSHIGNHLTHASQLLGEVDLIIGDDGQIHII